MSRTKVTIESLEALKAQKLKQQPSDGSWHFYLKENHKGLLLDAVRSSDYQLLDYILQQFPKEEELSPEEKKQNKHKKNHVLSREAIIKEGYIDNTANSDQFARYSLVLMAAERGDIPSLNVILKHMPQGKHADILCASSWTPLYKAFENHSVAMAKFIKRNIPDDLWQQGFREIGNYCLHSLANNFCPTMYSYAQTEFSDMFNEFIDVPHTIMEEEQNREIHGHADSLAHQAALLDNLDFLKALKATLDRMDEITPLEELTQPANPDDEPEPQKRWPLAISTCWQGMHGIDTTTVKLLAKNGCVKTLSFILDQARSLEPDIYTDLFKSAVSALSPFNKTIFIAQEIEKEEERKEDNQLNRTSERTLGKIQDPIELEAVSDAAMTITRYRQKTGLSVQYIADILASIPTLLPVALSCKTGLANLCLDASSPHRNFTPPVPDALAANIESFLAPKHTTTGKTLLDAHHILETMRIGSVFIKEKDPKIEKVRGTTRFVKKLLDQLSSPGENRGITSITK